MRLVVCLAGTMLTAAIFCASLRWNVTAIARTGHILEIHGGVIETGRAADEAAPGSEISAGDMSLRMPLFGFMRAKGLWALRIPILVFIVPFALASIGPWRRFWRARRGRCVCGYELSGLGPESVCPECGRARAPAADAE